MQVSKALQARVNAELVKCIAILEKKFVGYKFPVPTVNYFSRGSKAGTAEYRKWTININAGLLCDPKNEDEMVEQTVPHELAHLVTFKVYPETMNAGPVQYTRRGLKRGKREVHGPRWQSVMLAMGKTPDRCHTMDTSNVSSRRQRYEWLCTGCNTVIQLGPKHNLRQQVYGDISHRGCNRAKLVHPTTAKVATPVVTAPPTAPNPVPALQGSKIDICKMLYLKFSMLPRADVIAKFKSQAGCTDAGAGTYYATCKKLYG